MDRLSIYVAAPLFCEAELLYNLRIKAFLQQMGFEVFLPQIEAGLVSDFVSKGGVLSEARARIFDMNLAAIKKASILLIVLDGRVPDEGACIEAGIAFGLGIECVGFQTDSRSLQFGVNNLMIDGVLKDRIARSFGQLKQLLKAFDNNPLMRRMPI